MNAIKKQLKIPTSFSGMKKAVSTSNITDRLFLENDHSPHNLTLDNKNIKLKTASTSSQDLAELLNCLHMTITERSNENFISDDLPMILSTDWLNAKQSSEYGARMQQKNSAILELLNTELNYLNQMQFLLDVSSKVFSNLQQRYFSYVNIDDVFLNLGEIYEVNYQFWVKYLYPSFESAKDSGTCISSSSWKNGFNQISSMFLPYQVYCSKMTQCQKHIQSLEKDKYFLQFSQWFSHVEQSNRESLSDFIAKPFQRLTKYKLLLTTISSYSDDHEEQDHLTEMINSINTFLKQVECKLSISHISMRMEPIELVEPPNEDLMELCSPYRNIDLTVPINQIDGEIMRQLLKEGTFKLKEAQTKIIDVTIIMFTDLILICQKMKNFEVDRIKVIKPIIPLCKLDTISPLHGSLVLRVIDDFGCLAAMYLLTSDHTTTNEWIEAIQDAQFHIKTQMIHRPSVDHKIFPMLKVNVINSSPITGRSPTPTGTIKSAPPSSPKFEPFNRNSKMNGSESFSRSNFRSSPIVRRRFMGGSPSKERAESLHENYFLGSEFMSRSLSHQSILEIDDDDPDINNLDSSLTSADFRTEDFKSSLRRLDGVNMTPANNELRNDRNSSKKCDISLRLNERTTDKLNEMRAYGSMMNLSMNSK